MSQSVAGARFDEGNSTVPLRVLIVDDEPLIRMCLADAMHSDGFDVIEVSPLSKAGMPASPPRLRREALAELAQVVGDEQR